MIDALSHIDALLSDDHSFFMATDDTFLPDPLSLEDLLDLDQSESPKKRRPCNTFINKEGRVIRGKPCSFPAGCYNRAQSGGLCKAHGGGARCNVDGCNRSSQGRGKCRTHGGGKRCSFKGCEKGTQRKGYCFFHRASKNN